MSKVDLLTVWSDSWVDVDDLVHLHLKGSKLKWLTPAMTMIARERAVSTQQFGSFDIQRLPQYLWEGWRELEFHVWARDRGIRYRRQPITEKHARPPLARKTNAAAGVPSVSP